MIVPEGQTVYIGNHEFKTGDTIPDYLIPDGMSQNTAKTTLKSSAEIKSADEAKA